MSALPQPLPLETQQALRAAFERLRAGYEAERDPTHAVRTDRLRRLEAMVERMAGPMCEAIAADFGHRPRQVTQMADIAPVLMSSRHARRHLKAWMRTRRMPTSLIHRPGTNTLMRQPLGVVGIVSPWNFPGLLALAPAVAALAAGNRVMLKPSEIGPRFAALLHDEVGRAFAPDEMVVVTGDAELARAFVSLPFNHLLYTGSTAVGRQVAMAAAANLTPVTLELGGKSPAIIGAGAEMPRSTLRLAAGKLLNAGQACIAPDYVAVPRARVDAFVDGMRRAHRKLHPTVAGNPDAASIATERHFQRLLALLDDARAQGGQVVPLLDEAPDARRRQMPLHLVLQPKPGMRVMQEEIFGPILPVLPYGHIDEVIAHVNAGDRPLALYWFGRDRAERDQVLRHTVVGGVTINDTLWHIAQESLPFGGVGASGIGAYHGEWGFRTFSKETGVYHQSPASGIGLLYPPYGATFDKISALLTKVG